MAQRLFSGDTSCGLPSASPNHHLRPRKTLAACAALFLIAAGIAPQAAFAAISLSPNTWYALVARNSGSCLDVTGLSTTQGTQLQEWACLGQTNQQFSVTAVSGGYEITARNSGLSLNVAGYSTANGTPIIQWPYSQTSNDIWTLSAPDANGYVSLTPLSDTAACMDITQGSTANGTKVQEYQCNGTPAQKWRFVAVGSSAPPPALTAFLDTPASGATFTYPENFMVEVTAKEFGGCSVIQGVNVYVDGALSGGTAVVSASACEYGRTLYQVLSAGTHSIYAIATDTAGHTAKSNTISVTVASTVTQVNGQCGSANGTTASSAPTTSLCLTGTATTVSGSGPWTWACDGSNGGTNASCSAQKTPTVVNGQCGSSNGLHMSAKPSGGLCNTGTTTTVSGTGPWTWACDGSNGGSNVSCEALTVQTASGGQWSMGEYAWFDSPSVNIYWPAITHLIHEAAVAVNADGSLSYTCSNWSNCSESTFGTAASALTSTAHAHGVKVTFALAQANALNTVSSSNGLTNTLVANIAHIMSAYGYDGVEFDWETNLNYTGYSNLITALRTQIGFSNIITLTTWGDNNAFYVSQASKIDRINFQGFDKVGCSPLGSYGYCQYPWFNDAGFSNATYEGSNDTVAQQYRALGMPMNKFDVSIPFYGYMINGVTNPRATSGSFSASQINYNNIVNSYNLSGAVWDSAAQVPWLPISGGYITYDNTQSVTDKISYARNNNLGGWFIWQISGDYVPSASTSAAMHPLLSAVAAACGGSCQ